MKNDTRYRQTFNIGQTTITVGDYRDGLIPIKEVMDAGKEFTSIHQEKFMPWSEIKKRTKFKNYMNLLREDQGVEPIVEFQGRMYCTVLAAVEIAQRISDKFKLEVAKVFLYGKVLDHRMLSHIEFLRLGQVISNFYEEGTYNTHDEGEQTRKAMMYITKKFNENHGLRSIKQEGITPEVFEMRTLSFNFLVRHTLKRGAPQPMLVDQVMDLYSTIR